MSNLSSDEQLALLVHDLNNGLTVAQAGVEFATEIDGQLAPDTRNALCDAQHALDRMRVMLQQFLDTYQLEEARAPVARTSAVLADVVGSAVRVIGTAAKHLHVKIEVSRERCDLNLGLIDRAIANLVMNAVRYAGTNGSIRVVAWVDDGDVVIDVGNSGAPPPPDLLPHLFEKFAIGATGQHGLGLYFCGLVAEAHGGRACYEPVPEIATNFRIRFPATLPASA